MICRPEQIAWMEARSIFSVQSLLTFFVDRVISILEAENREMLAWDEIREFLPLRALYSTVVQQWRSSTNFALLDKTVLSSTMYLG